MPPPANQGKPPPWAIVGYSIMETTHKLGGESEILREHMQKLEIALAKMAAAVEANAKAIDATREMNAEAIAESKKEIAEARIESGKASRRAAAAIALSSIFLVGVLSLVTIVLNSMKDVVK